MAGSAGCEDIPRPAKDDWWPTALVPPKPRFACVDDSDQKSSWAALLPLISSAMTLGLPSSVTLVISGLWRCFGVIEVSGRIDEDAESPVNDSGTLTC